MDFNGTRLIAGGKNDWWLLMRGGDAVLGSGKH